MLYFPYQAKGAVVSVKHSVKILTALCWFTLACCSVELIWYSKKTSFSYSLVFTPALGYSLPFTASFLFVFALFFFFYVYALTPGKKNGHGIFALSFFPTLALTLLYVIFALPYYQQNTLDFWYIVVYLLILISVLCFSICLFYKFRNKAAVFPFLKLLFITFVIACAIFLIKDISFIILDYIEAGTIIYTDYLVVSFLQFWIIMFSGFFLYKLLTDRSAYSRFVSAQAQSI